MTGRRIRSTSKGGTTGGTTLVVNTPSAFYAEDSQVDDNLHVHYIKQLEDAAVDDNLSVHFIKELEDAQVSDDFLVPTLTPAFAEDGSANDLTKIVVLSIDCPRSGTPDTDLLSDAWTDQASTGTNHGNESLLVKGNQTAGSNERRAYMLIDFNLFAGFIAAGTGVTVTFKASTTSAVLASTLSWNASVSTAKPLVESTLTWSGQPAANSGLGTGSVSVAAGAAQTFSITMTAANIQTQVAMGAKYAFIIFTMASTALPETVTILSRDNATASNRPTLAFDYIQRGT